MEGCTLGELISLSASLFVIAVIVIYVIFVHKRSSRRTKHHCLDTSVIRACKPRCCIDNSSVYMK